MRTTLAELARKAGAEVLGDPSRAVSGVATLEAAGPDQLAVFHHAGYRQAFAATRAGAVVLSPESAKAATDGGPAFLVSGDPYLAFAKISALFHPVSPAKPGIDPRAAVDRTAEVDPSAEVQPFAYVGPRARVGPGTVLHAFACIGAEAVVGAGCVLHPGAVVAHGCVLGDRVILQPGAVVGSDGFGYALDPQGPAHVPAHFKVPQVGRARIEDDVEVGANSCVDRATLGETVVGRGAKIDNLVQVAHNVTIGPLSILCAQVGIAGSSKLGAGVVLGGQAGVAGHLSLGDGARVAARGGVMNDIPAGETRSGAPALPHRRWLRQMVAERQLPELLAEIQDLRARLTALEARAEGPGNASAEGPGNARAEGPGEAQSKDRAGT